MSATALADLRGIYSRYLINNLYETCIMHELDVPKYDIRCTIARRAKILSLIANLKEACKYNYPYIIMSQFMKDVVDTKIHRMTYGYVFDPMDNIADYHFGHCECLQECCSGKLPCIFPNIQLDTGLCFDHYFCFFNGVPYDQTDEKN